MSIHLFKHNQQAYRAVTAMLEKEKMAAVIHPTGTGKSLIAFKLAEEHPSEKFLWLSPSEYIYQTQLENLGMEFDNIQFMSYSRLMKNEDSIETLHPDYIILDEFHRCGAAEWGKSVRKLLTACPDAKRLGLSATNIRYLDNQRNMAEEIFDGKIASEMTLGEAIVRGILPEPKYVIAMYSYKKELDQLKKRVQALSNQGLITENQKLLEQLRRALEQAEGLDIVFEKHMEKKNGKYIVFCSGKEHMDEMKEQASTWFRRVDREPRIYTAFYNDTATDREFREFKKDNSEHLKLLFCIDMLNEGVHVDDVDGVILLRPTVSPIIYLQQIGRALSAGSGKTPVIFDLVNNFDSLSCIDCLKKEMEEAADKYIKLLQIKTASRETPIKSLSGGNQQKVIIGRWLLTNPDYLILDEPTRGIDIGTKTEIQKLVLDLADQGMAVTFISSEVEEMLRTCSRMAVLRDGEKVGELEESELSQSNIMKAIAGGDDKNE